MQNTFRVFSVVRGYLLNRYFKPGVFKTNITHTK